MWIRERCEACEGSGAHPVQYFAEVWFDAADGADEAAAAELEALADDIRLCAECGGNGWIDADAVGGTTVVADAHAPADGDGGRVGARNADARGDTDRARAEFAAAGFDPDTSVEALVAAELAATHGLAATSSRRASA